MTKARTLETAKRPAPQLDTPTDLSQSAVQEISAALNVLLADAFALYLKTKNFHWHVSGPHFRDYHLMLDEQAAQILATTDELAERARKVGGTTLRSIGDIAGARPSRTTTRRSWRRATCFASSRRQQVDGCRLAQGP